MFELKPLSADAVPAALAKAERYRLLSEPAEAASICLDILRIDAEHQPTLVMLLLALTDQFEQDPGCVAQARQVLARLRDPYERAYYAGIVAERQAKSQWQRSVPGARAMAGDLLREAMGWYEKAEAIRPPGNDDALLRWNACARMIMQHPSMAPSAEERPEPLFLE